MRIIKYIKSLFETKYVSKYDEDLYFSISIGEVCEICHVELPPYYKGEPTKCETCEKQLNRESKLKEIGI